MTTNHADLISRLRAREAPLNDPDLNDEAADAIAALVAESERLRSERDAAMKGIEAALRLSVCELEQRKAAESALSYLIAKASDYVKPRRTTDARQSLLSALDATRAGLCHNQTGARRRCPAT